jgi:hypothetical protein
MAVPVNGQKRAKADSREPSRSLPRARNESGDAGEERNMAYDDSLCAEVPRFTALRRG